MKLNALYLLTIGTDGTVLGYINHLLNGLRISNARLAGSWAQCNRPQPYAETKAASSISACENMLKLRMRQVEFANPWCCKLKSLRIF